MGNYAARRIDVCQMYTDRAVIMQYAINIRAYILQRICQIGAARVTCSRGLNRAALFRHNAAAVFLPNRMGIFYRGAGCLCRASFIPRHRDVASSRRGIRPKEEKRSKGRGLSVVLVALVSHGNLVHRISKHRLRFLVEDLLSKRTNRFRRHFFFPLRLSSFFKPCANGIILQVRQIDINFGKTVTKIESEKGTPLRVVPFPAAFRSIEAIRPRFTFERELLSNFRTNGFLFFQREQI